MSQRHSLVGTGLYRIPRAAQLVGADVRNVRRWLKGYSRRTASGTSITQPLWLLQYADDEEIGGDYVLGFKDLMELRMVTQLIRQGVSLQAVRATIEVAREGLGPYPLQSKRFLTDGKRIFMDVVGASAQDRRLVDVRRRQYVFDRIVRPALKDQIDFDGNGQPLRWFPLPRKRLIVIDPSRQFGHPIIERTGVPTITVHQSYMAEKGALNFVSRLWRATPQEVMAAVEFEQRVAA